MLKWIPLRYPKIGFPQVSLATWIDPIDSTGQQDISHIRTKHFQPTFFRWANSFPNPFAIFLHAVERQFFFWGFFFPKKRPSFQGSEPSFTYEPPPVNSIQTPKRGLFDHHRNILGHSLNPPIPHSNPNHLFLSIPYPVLKPYFLGDLI